MNTKVEEASEIEEGIWKDDLLGREADAQYLLRFLVNRAEQRKKHGQKGSYVMNLDAEWGQGKSFFMRRFAQEIAMADHPVVFINAWEDDFGDDPFTVVMAEIDSYLSHRLGKNGFKGELKKAYTNLKANYKEVMVTSLQGMAKRSATWAIGAGAEKVSDLVLGGANDAEKAVGAGATETGSQPNSSVEAAAREAEAITLRLIDRYAENRIASFKKGQNSMRLFRDSLAAFVASLSKSKDLEPPLFILVDELDRCRPTYALSMLERIKHLFDVPNVIFVMATDTKQLTASIAAVYGQTFDGARYLQRFFNRGYQLPRPSRRRIVELAFETGLIDASKLQSPGPLNDNIGTITGADAAFDLSLRELQQTLDILGSLSATWETGLRIQVPLMFGLIVSYLRKEPMDDCGASGSWLEQRLKEIKSWNAVHEGTIRGFRHFHAVVDMAAFTRHLASQAHRDLSKIHAEDDGQRFHEQSVDSPMLVRMYVKDILRRDYSDQGANVRHSGDPEPRSSLLRYPKLIQQAGRLTSE